MLQFDFVQQVNLINGSLADKALATDDGYRLILTICHQENSQVPSPDADLFPEKCPRLFELPRACFDHSAVGLQVD
ncbi:MAG: hypothetical protein QOH31_3101 [Verrucomicrobiota bacterium]|jgi:hypothetical protein